MNTQNKRFNPFGQKQLAVLKAAVAVLAVGLASAAQARDNVTFSVSVGVPGVPHVVVGASNAYPVYGPVYGQPQVIYTQPQVVYVQPRPVYVQPAPVYYQAPQQIYYGKPHKWKHGHGHGYGHGFKNEGKHGGWTNQGYAPVYYQR